MFHGCGYILISFFTLNLSASGYKMKQTAAMVTEQILILLNDVFVWHILVILCQYSWSVWQITQT